MRYQTKDILQIAKAIRDDAAGNKQATMTEMDLAGNMLESLARHRDQLRTEIETLRKDAERYRWLRDGCDHKRSEATRIAVNLYGMEWDAAIDAAMSAKEAM